MQKLNFDTEELARVSQEFKLKFVILHGSQATGKNRIDSDLDIVVVSKNPTELQQRFLGLTARMADVFSSASSELDLKIMPIGEPLFRYQIIRDGQLLYGNPTDYLAYRLASIRLYHDSRDLFDLEDKLVNKAQHRLEEAVHAG